MAVLGPTAIRQLSPSLCPIDDVCNVDLIKRGERAILGDSGVGVALDVLDVERIESLDWMLHTHLHRDQPDV